MTRELQMRTMKAIEAKLAKADTGRENRYWYCCRAKFVFGNNRVATVCKHTPDKKANKSNLAKTHYTISFLGSSGVNNHMTLEEVAKKLYELGIENVDPFKDGVNTKKLKDLGFQQIELLQEPNIKDIGFMLEDGFYQYKLEMDMDSIYYGPSYSDGCAGYYGSTYEDAFRREYLYVRHTEDGNWTKALYRDVKIGSRCVNNYVGD